MASNMPPVAPGRKIVLLIGAITLFLLPIGSAFYKFFYQKEYTFVVEQTCDPVYEKCYSRSCANEECPPNNLEVYKVVSINAYEFSQCLSPSCIEECESGKIICEAIPCDSEQDTCTSTK